VDDGATHETVACPFPLVAVTVSGFVGIAEGVTAAEGAEERPVPLMFDAATLNV
jgi:hypothetical protein